MIGLKCSGQVPRQPLRFVLRWWLVLGGAATVTLLSTLAGAGELEDEARAWQAAEQEKNRLRRSTVPSSLPVEGTVEFPNGESVAVRFRASDVENTKEAQLDLYPSLRRAAEAGDLLSARTVAEWMSFCGFLRRLPIATEPPYAPYSLTKKEPVRTEANQATTESSRRASEFCDQRTPEEIASATRLFRMAAGGGDIPAMVRLSELLSGSDEAVQMLDAAWKRGSLFALGRMSKAYGRRSMASGPESDDALRSLAARWLYAKLNEGAFRRHAVPSEFVEALNRDLAGRLERANSSLRTGAIARARQMLSENKQCCSIP